jgi:F420-non-reducing hydrogenase large subunit
MRQIAIDPITRLEGHGKIEIFLDERGDVANAYLQIPSCAASKDSPSAARSKRWRSSPAASVASAPRRITLRQQRRPTPSTTSNPPRPAKLLRELLYSAFFCTDHTTHFYALAGPDFIMGPDAPVAERNILGVIHKVGTGGQRAR